MLRLIIFYSELFHIKFWTRNFEHERKRELSLTNTSVKVGHSCWLVNCFYCINCGAAGARSVQKYRISAPRAAMAATRSVHECRVSAPRAASYSICARVQFFCPTSRQLLDLCTSVGFRPHEPPATLSVHESSVPGPRAANQIIVASDEETNTRK